MFVKVFEQILDSSIARDYELRHFFEDMLKLADRTGAVDMTADAIARRINLPESKVLPLLEKLQLPDAESRTPDNEGRRIVLLDSHRNWGWMIVNYERYRNIRDEETRRRQNRDAQSRFREKHSRKRRDPKVNAGLKRGKPLAGETAFVKQAKIESP